MRYLLNAFLTSRRVQGIEIDDTTKRVISSLRHRRGRLDSGFSIDYVRLIGLVERGISLIGFILRRLFYHIRP